MAELALLWIQYGFVSLAIVYSGSRVSKHLDEIADRGRLSRAWLGLTALAAVTSLPELITGISAVAIFDLPDIAVGDIAGSCVFNLLILALLDAMLGQRSLFQTASRALIRPALWSVLLLATAGAALYLGASLPSLARIGPASFVFVGLYIMALLSTRRPGPTASASSQRRASTRNLWLRFARDSMVVIAAATFLPYLGGELSIATGLASTFVGNLLVAASTSLPELVTATAAVRRSAADLAVGDLIGSNLFDIAILAVDDVFYRPASLLAVASLRHGYSFLAALLMTLLVIMGLQRRARKRFGLAPESWLLVMIYVGVFIAFVVL